jgi:carbonic anhydrase/acetyltransferase-like protein (isoleucine patch superfamily)
VESLIGGLAGFTPHIAEDAWVAPGAVVLGDVTLGSKVSVFYGCVLRSEHAPIVIGEGTNLQDGVIAHADPGFPCTIGARVSVGHRATLHGCTVGDDVLVGMSATLLNGCSVGSWSLVAAGAVVRERFVVPPGTLVAGVPAKVMRELTDDERVRIELNAAVYLDTAEVHKARG